MNGEETRTRITFPEKVGQLIDAGIKFLDVWTKVGERAGQLLSQVSPEKVQSAVEHIDQVLDQATFMVESSHRYLDAQTMHIKKQSEEITGQFEALKQSVSTISKESVDVKKRLGRVENGQKSWRDSRNKPQVAGVKSGIATQPSPRTQHTTKPHHAKSEGQVKSQEQELNKEAVETQRRFVNTSLKDKLSAVAVE